MALAILPSGEIVGSLNIRKARLRQVADGIVISSGRRDFWAITELNWDDVHFELMFWFWAEFPVSVADPSLLVVGRRWVYGWWYTGMTKVIWSAYIFISIVLRLESEFVSDGDFGSERCDSSLKGEMLGYRSCFLFEFGEGAGAIRLMIGEAAVQWFVIQRTTSYGIRASRKGRVY